MSINISNHVIKEQIIVNGKPFPFVIKNNNITIENDFLSWIDNHKDDLKSLMLEYDAVLFRGFPIANSNLFEKMLTKAQFPTFEYVGGAAPRTNVTAGRVLTANESPSTEDIPFHHEMAQTPNPPNSIFFYCDTPAESGGATPIIQSNIIYETLNQFAPDYANYLEDVGVRYMRIMPEKTDTGSAIGRSWKETFQCDTRSEAEQKMSELNYEWQWLDNGDLKTITGTLPAIRVDKKTGKKVFFNSIIAVFQGWNDSRNIGEKSVQTGDGQFIDKDILNTLLQKVKTNVVAFEWHKNDVIWINNNTVLHSREPYEGHRKVCASLA